MCLSQSGSFAGSEDIAAFAPVAATTSSDAAMHGAKMAVDSDTATYDRLHSCGQCDDNSKTVRADEALSVVSSQ